MVGFPELVTYIVSKQSYRLFDVSMDTDGGPGSLAEERMELKHN